MTPNEKLFDERFAQYGLSMADIQAAAVKGGAKAAMTEGVDRQLQILMTIMKSEFPIFEASEADQTPEIIEAMKRNLPIMGQRLAELFNEAWELLAQKYGVDLPSETQL